MTGGWRFRASGITGALFHNGFNRSAGVHFYGSHTLHFSPACQPARTDAWPSEMNMRSKGISPFCVIHAFFSQGWNQERNLVIFHEFWKDNLMKSYSTKQETVEKLMTIRKLSLFLALEPTMYTGSTDIWSSCCFIIIIPFRITLLCFFLPSYSLNHSASMLFLSSPLFLLLLHYQSYYKSKLKFQISGNF